MGHIESPIQEELDRLDTSIRDLRRLVVMNGGNSNPAPAASHASEAAVLLGQEEQADALRRVERVLDALPDRIAEALATHFAVVEEEEEPEEPEGKKKGGKPKGDKSEGENDDEEPEAPKRRAYFRSTDDS